MVRPVLPEHATAPARARVTARTEGEVDAIRVPAPPLLVALAICVLLSAAAEAQVNPFRGSGGRGLSPEDNRLLFESVARLNAAEPTHVGRSEGWSNPQTNSFRHLHHTPGFPT